MEQLVLQAHKAKLVPLVHRATQVLQVYKEIKVPPDFKVNKEQLD
jgi:hypothetical protein